ncbi:hypothetical protein IC582_009265 [Cucumis melo]
MPLSIVNFNSNDSVHLKLKLKAYNIKTKIDVFGYKTIICKQKKTFVFIKLI